MLTNLIQQELTKPERYKPIARGWFIALLLVSFCTLSVPFYFIFKIFKR